MGGRGTIGQNKTFSIIGAERNRAFQEARRKEIETERMSTPVSRSKPRSTISDKISTKKSSVSVFTEIGKDSKGYPIFGKKLTESLASSRDGNLHVTQSGKDSFHVIDAKNGHGVTTVGFSNKKKAIAFLNSATTRNGTMSPTLKRSLEFSNASRAELQNFPEQKRKALARAHGAVSKLRNRIEYG